MSRRLPPALLLLALLATPLPAAAEEFTPAQQEEINRLVRQYILDHPEVILEAVQALESRKQAAADERRAAAIDQAYDNLARHPETPVIGNPDGDVVVVEFFDYNCGYCRKMTQDMYDLVEQDGGIRYVMKELPIFGEDSRFAAKAALAAARQGRYAEFHYALMTAGVTIDVATTQAIAQSIGLDMTRLEQDMLDPALDEELDRNYALARALGVEGTPALVVGRQFVPGARPYDEMERLVAEARAAKP